MQVNQFCSDLFWIIPEIWYNGTDKNWTAYLHEVWAERVYYDESNGSYYMDGMTDDDCITFKDKADLIEKQAESIARELWEASSGKTSFQEIASMIHQELLSNKNIDLGEVMSYIECVLHRVIESEGVVKDAINADEKKAKLSSMIKAASA